MAYVKTNWVNNDEPPISAANLQNAEDGIEHNDIRLNNLDNIMSLTPNSWVANQEYTIHDIVVYNGMLYENITGNNSDTTPDSDVNNWSETKLLAQNSDGLVKINNKLLPSYSTTEQIIGTWNGKPLYRKVITGTKVSGTDLSLLVDNDAEEITEVSGKIAIFSYFYILPFYENSNVYVRMEIRNSGKSIVIKSGTSEYSNGNVSIIVCYTKTTD